jgi:hypothetical protein
MPCKCKRHDQSFIVTLTIARGTDAVPFIKSHVRCEIRICIHITRRSNTRILKYLLLGSNENERKHYSADNMVLFLSHRYFMRYVHTLDISFDNGRGLSTDPPLILRQSVHSPFLFFAVHTIR